MSDATNLPRPDREPEDPFAPETVDEWVASAVSASSASSAHVDAAAARLVAALAVAHRLPLEAEATLQRVRQRIQEQNEMSRQRSTSEQSATDERPAESSGELSGGQPLARPDGHRPGRFGVPLRAVAAVLLVALLGGAFYVVLSGHAQVGPASTGDWHDVRITKARTTQPLDFDPAKGVTYAVSDVSGIIYACGSNHLWYSSDGGQTYAPFPLKDPLLDLTPANNLPQSPCMMTTVPGLPGVFINAPIGPTSQLQYATPQSTNWRALYTGDLSPNDLAQGEPVHAIANPSDTIAITPDTFAHPFFDTQPISVRAAGNWLFVEVNTGSRPALVATSDFGQTWWWLDEPLQRQHATCYQFAVDPADPSRVICATSTLSVSPSGGATAQFNAAWKTPDGGKTWQELPQPANTLISGVAASATSFYAITASATDQSRSHAILVKQPIAGGAWQQVAEVPLPAAQESNAVSALSSAVDDYSVTPGDMVYLTEYGSQRMSPPSDVIQVTVTLFVLRPGATTFSQVGSNATFELGNQVIVFEPGGTWMGSSPALYAYGPRSASGTGTLYRLALP